MPLDPEAKAYLDRLIELGVPPVQELTPEQARQNVRAAVPGLVGEMEPVARREDRVIAGTPCRIVAPSSAAPLPVLAYFHGGGWVTGDRDTYEVVGRAIANRAGCVVVLPEFRSAPEHRYPAALEDCWAATTWLAQNAPEIGGDATRLAVGGDSAGGNLAAVVARRARDAGVPSLALQVLIYPVLDCEVERPSYHRNATGYLLTREAMAWYWDQYVPRHAQRTEPDASPLRAPDLSGVAPALVIVAEFDPLLDEGEAYAARLANAGVPVRRIREEGMIHGYIRTPAVISRARKSWDDIGTALKAAFGESPPAALRSAAPATG